MKRLFACLSLCLLLAACASPLLHDERADERAADAAAAQALAASAPVSTNCGSTLSFSTQQAEAVTAPVASTVSVQ